MKLKILIVLILSGCIGITLNASFIGSVTIGNLSYDIYDVKGHVPQKYARLAKIEGDIETLNVPTEVEYGEYKKESYPVCEISIGNQVLEKYKRFRQTLKKIVAPSVVEVYGFHDCVLLEEAEFSNDIISIADFKRCVKLKKITIGDKLERIGEGAFYGCSSLFVGGLRLPASIKRIENDAFRDCTSLAFIDLSRCVNLKEIMYRAFQNSNIESVTFPGDGSTLSSIADMAFADCKRLGHGENSRISLSSSITRIGDGAFMNCSSMKAINLKNAIPYYSTDNEIWYGVFNGCAALTTIDLSDKITVIPPRMFENCVSLNKITIPDNVTTICENAFLNCTSLTGSLKKPFKLPAKLEEIRSQAFMDCSSLKWINYVKTNKTIRIKEKAFANNTDLEYFVVRKIDTTPLSRSSSEGGLIIESNVFYGCANLKSVPEGASSISPTAFGWDFKFTSITVPCYCTNVTSDVLNSLCDRWINYRDVNTIYFAGEVGEIASNANSNLTELSNVYFLSPMSEDGEFAKLSIQANAFSSNKKIALVECSNPTPPELHENGFTDDTYKNANLIVPEESVELYKNANGWKRFLKINGQMSGLGEVIESEGDNVECYYDLCGIRIDYPVRGQLYIVKYSNGKVEKVIF